MKQFSKLTNLTISVVFSVVGAPRQSTKEELSLQVHNPHDVVVAKGHSAQFECDATSTFNDRLNVTWYHNGTPLNSSTPPYAINGTHLTIEKVAMSGKRKNVVLGEYTCLVRNIKGAILSSAAKLRTACKYHEIRKLGKS